MNRFTRFLRTVFGPEDYKANERIRLLETELDATLGELQELQEAFDEAKDKHKERKEIVLQKEKIIEDLRLRVQEMTEGRQKDQFELGKLRAVLKSRNDVLTIIKDTASKALVGVDSGG